MLKNIITTIVKKVEVRDLDDAITEFLKSKSFTDSNFLEFGYESAAENEWSNYEEHSFEVEPVFPSDFNTQILDLSTARILNWMCAEKQLESGNYLVSYSW